MLAFFCLKSSLDYWAKLEKNGQMLTFALFSFDPIDWDMLRFALTMTQWI